MSHTAMTKIPYDTPWNVYLENEHDPMDGFWIRVCATDVDTAREAALHFRDRILNECHLYAVKYVRRRTGAAA